MRQLIAWITGNSEEKTMLRKILVPLACAVLFTTPLAFAKGPAPDAPTSPSARQQAPDDSQLVEHGTYHNRDGKTVHAPAHSKSGRAPQGASAKCGDGTYSFSQHHSGTCSRHGGVADWL